MSVALLLSGVAGLAAASVLALGRGLRARRGRAVAVRLVPASSGGRHLDDGRAPQPMEAMACDAHPSSLGFVAASATSHGSSSGVLEHVLGRALQRSDVALPPGQVLRLWSAGTAVVGLLGTAAGGPTLGLLGLVAGAAGPALVLWSTRDRRLRRLDRDLPLVLDAVAGSLRGGASLAGALEAGATVPGPAGEAVAALNTAVRAGRPLPDALERWQREVGGHASRLVSAALALAAEAGGAAPRAVDGVAATLRERIEVADEVQALGAQARLSAVVIALAPIGFALVAGSTDPRTVAFLLGTPVGLACLVVGVALDMAAYLWMRRIVGEGR